MLDLTNYILMVSGFRFKIKSLKYDIKKNLKFDGNEELIEEIEQLESELNKINLFFKLFKKPLYKI